jgi:oligosaccharide translocation protein RFT1
MAKRRVLAEASNLFVFNLVFVGLAIYWPSLGALSYSVARLLNALILVIGSYVSLPTDIKTMPASLQTVGFDWDYLKLVKAYYKQSIYKQILTEGERYLIAAFGLLTFSESGIYDLINNLGSIIARFVFLPIEEASYILFTNSLKRGFTIDKQPDQKAAKEAKTYFELVTKIVSLVGITVLVYGQSYSALLLHIYGGSRQENLT